MIAPVGPNAPVTQCVILAGRGDAVPPLVDHLIDEVARFGIDDFLVIPGSAAPPGAGDRGSRQARDGRSLTVTIFNARADGGAGALSRLLEQLCDTFLLINGDTFFDCNIAGFVRPALTPDRMIRLAVCRDCSPPNSAMVALEGERVVRMIEKPQVDSAGWTSTGISYLRKGAISLFDRVPYSLERDILPQLLRMQAIEARRFAGPLITLGATVGSEVTRHLFPIRRAAVFFDRDGVLNEDSGYVHRPDELRWLPGARECVRAVNDSGRFAFVVTNQSGVARGYYDEDAVCAFHAEMQRQMLAVGAHIDDFAFCPHHPDGTMPLYTRHCGCRKPMPGMILQLLDRWPVWRQDSILIGDRPSDLLAAEAAGIGGRLYGGGDLRQVLSVKKLK